MRKLYSYPGLKLKLMYSHLLQVHLRLAKLRQEVEELQVNVAKERDR